MLDWKVVCLKAAFILSCLTSLLRAADNVHKLPFCNPNHASNSDIVIVSTLDGRLTAFSTSNGIKAWHVDTKPLLSSNLHHVELTAGGKWVRLVPSLRGSLYSLSGETIEPLPFDSDQLLSSSFKYSDDMVIAGARETLWLGLDADSGAVVYECGSGGCASEQQTASGGRDVLVLRRHSSTVRALDPRSGSEKWNFSVAEHQLALNRRECAGGHAGPSSAVAVAVAVALPEGVVAIRRPGDLQPLWKQKLEAPVAGMWRLHGGSLQHIDVLWEATQSLVEGGYSVPPSLYIGLHNTQLYIQESQMYAQSVETALSTKPMPWKLMDSRPLLNGGDTALSGPLQDSDPNTLSLITLYGNTGKTGNHGFFLYLQETCDQAVQVSEESFDTGHDEAVEAGEAGEAGPGGDEHDEHHHVHVHVYSLWFWWKEVLLIAISSALLMNLMIWPRFFAPKLRPATPLPLNQEYIVVERHYERRASISTAEYSGRYENDFTPLRCLGRGGFGVVFEVRNNIDYCFYAVKRITLPRRESKRERVLREVRVLAKLEHEHIVRYFNAWVEEPPPFWQEQRDAVWIRELEGATGALTDEYTTSVGSAQAPKAAPKAIEAAHKADSVLLNIQRPFDDCIEALDYDKASKRNRSMSCSNSFSIVFDPNASDSSKAATNHHSHSGASRPSAASKHAASTDEDSFIVFEEPPAPSLTSPPAHRLNTLQNTESYKKTDNSPKKKKKGHTRHWSLDMCVVSGETDRPTRGTKMYLYIQMQLCRRDSLHDWLRSNQSWESRGDKVKCLFSQIVSAVEYVHLAGLIHRDLKPSNILFAPDGKVKVGDFGLVTAMCEGSQDAPAEQCANRTPHTYQVGTHLYMSPEQLQGRPYGFKVDIFSLGLILFELLHPFGTESERVASLRGVRGGHYPEQFHSSHPKEMEVLKLMLSHDPERRPSATGVRAHAPLYENTDERWHYTLPNLGFA